VDTIGAQTRAGPLFVRFGPLGIVLRAHLMSIAPLTALRLVASARWHTSEMFF